MDWSGIIMLIIPPLATYLIGLVQNKPGYTKPKAVNAAITKALEDNKLTAAELQEIVDAATGK